MSARDQKIVILNSLSGRKEGLAKKRTFCMLVKMMKIVNHPLLNCESTISRTLWEGERGFRKRALCTLVKLSINFEQHLS